MPSVRKYRNRTQSTRRPPIHERSITPNLQSNSPFFNGRIPAEIRDQIFAYALTEYNKSDRLYPKGSNQCRPGYPGHKYVAVALLQTCRRVYLETYHLPPANKEHIFWHAPHTGPYGNNFDNIFDISHEQQYFKRFTPWQLCLVKDVHLFLQMYWLEQSFMTLCQQPFMQGIEKIKITIRKGDWWWCERGYPLGINAPRGDGDVLQMNYDVIEDRVGEVIPWNMSGWGGAFAQLKSIRELEMEFETWDQQKEELVAIANWAKTWRFPLHHGMVLSARDCVIGDETWTKAEPCSQCGEIAFCHSEEPMHDTCSRRNAILRLCEDEPLLHIRTVKWKLATMLDGR
jgi:hypothetical protein